MSATIENRTFDEIRLGEEASLALALRRDDIDAWTAVSGAGALGDLDPRLAPRTPQHASEAWAASLFSTIAGTLLPGVGSTTLESHLQFRRPVPVGERMRATLVAREKHPSTRTIIFDCRCTDRCGADLLTGRIAVKAPNCKIRSERLALPTTPVHHADSHRRLLRACAGLPALTTAVVHPYGADALRGAVEAAERQLINPILIGPAAHIRAMADEVRIDLSPYRLVDAEDSGEAVARALAMVRDGEAEALMKGSLHTDEFLQEVLREEAGLRTERHVSHCLLIALPNCARPVIVTDATINNLPSLEHKRDICRNAIDLAHALGIAQPHLAVVTAVERVTRKIPDTMEAAALCEMAERGQIVGGRIDGPVGFDNAIDECAAKTRGVVSGVAGRAEVLVAPDLDAANMLAKQLTFMAGAEAAGIVLGTRVPIVLASRADTVSTRLTSCALALLRAEHARQRERMPLAAE